MAQKPAQSSTSVLIVGAGPTGLALAIELGLRNIPTILLERNDRVGYAPRAKTTHTRTREHLRRWGIADKLAEASPFGVDYPSDVVFTTRLGGHALARFPNAFHCAPDQNDAYSEHAQWIPQYKLEDVMRQHVETLPTVEIRFSQEFVTAHQDADGVTVGLRDLAIGSDVELRARYVVGADGARSKVRDIIGATLEGRYGLSRNYNIVFRARGLAQAHSHGRAIMYWQINNDAPSLIGPMDTDDRWFFMPTALPDGVTLSDSEAADLIRRSTGIDLPCEILSRDEWVASQLIADKYRDSRIFLAGDACHLHPPFGGYGMNMGIADGVDLGWKLAAVISGWGGDGLLDSYEVERREVHAQVIAEATSNHAVLANQLWRPGLEDAGADGALAREATQKAIRQAKAREFHSLGVVLGYCYTSSPIISYERIPSSASEPMDFAPSAAPGRRAPHAWLNERTSLFDLFGPGYTLLAFGDSEKSLDAAQSDAHAAGVPLRVVQLERPDLARIYAASMALIRPDMHVAWRGEHWPGPQLIDLVAGKTAAAESALRDDRAGVREAHPI
ncbi:MAG TPA: FAD-dependent monooxygenase [Hyphomonadaceae bacterium]|nr:FAD-dependent monooxygenase [Hyphomonadaceae bacterium]HPN05035.1 FAD-dependent monooxygenase [Hyphomonadaceae bacterium]